MGSGNDFSQVYMADGAGYSGETVVYNFENLQKVLEDLLEVKENLQKAVQEAEDMKDSIGDSRVTDYYSPRLSEIRNASDNVDLSVPKVQEVIEYYQKASEDLLAANAKAEDIDHVTPNTIGPIDKDPVNPGKPDGLTYDDTDPDLGTGDTDTGNAGDFKPGTIGDAFNKLPQDVQDDIRDALNDLGFTDDEVQGIMDGTIKPDEMTMGAISSVLEQTAKDNPDFKDILEDALGFNIFEDDGKVNQALLALAALMAGKGLGMDVDLSPGSEFSKMLDYLEAELKDEFLKDPSLRQKIMDKYGIDIFNEDGTIDREKLATLKMMDGVDPDDDFDLDSMLGLEPYVPEEDPENSDGAGENEGFNPGDMGTGTGTGGNIGDSEFGGKKPSDELDSDDSKTNQPSEDDAERGSSLGATIVGIPDSDEFDSKFTHKGDIAGMSEATASAKDGVGGGMAGILETIGKGATKLASGVSPFTGGFGGEGGAVNSASAGIIAAASLAAGGAAAGGGVLVGKKMSYIRFTPEDWAALGEDYQMVIEKLMKRVGFSEDEVETFKNSKFKIRTSELKEHVKKIEKATVNSTDCEEELLKQYTFSMIDETGKVIDYLLFITMIVDGKNAIDSFNMYNTVNQYFENVDDADFIYSGISMEDYFDDIADEEEIKIANDPTIKKEEVEASEENEATDEPQEDLEEAFSPSLSKDWLKGIGIDE